MLSKVLNKEFCAECKFCCAFRRCSLWETPVFPLDTVKMLENKGFDFIKMDEYGLMDLKDSYKTSDSEEEAPCYFLDSNKGCTLSDDEKPFDCKIWPLRVMRDKENNLCITVATCCKYVEKNGIKEFETLVNEGLYKTISDYVKDNPAIIKDYNDDYPVIRKI